MKKHLIILLSLFLLIFFIPKIAFASIYFSDDFESGSFDKWEIIFGNWTIGDYQNSKWAVASSTGPQYEIQAGSFNWTDYELSFDMLPKFGVDRNVFFRVKNQRTFVLPNRNLPVGYMLHLKSDKFILKKWTPEIGEPLEKVYIGFPVNVVSNIKVRLENNNIKVFINNSNTPALDYTDLNEPFLNGRIALATVPGAVSSVVWYDNVVVTELPIFTPTPSPTTTPIPTPTSTPTPTPIPTPSPAKRVIVVPGMGSGWNTEAILNCELDPNHERNWTLAPFAEDIYEPLISILADEDYETDIFNYDWRIQIPRNGINLSTFINKIITLNERVNIVGHSMGGLVGRAYLEKEEENNKLEKMMMVGSPHEGSALSYPPWSGGDIWQDNLIAKIATSLLLKRCGGLFSNDRQTIQVYFPSTQNLLPTENYLKNRKLGSMTPVDLMTAQNNWLLPYISSSFLFYDTKVGTLSGTGFKTLERINIKGKRNKKDIRLGNWKDGKPTGKIFSIEGDSTVLLSSSQVDGATNEVINQNHSGLVYTPEGLSKILSFLTNKPVTVQTKYLFSEPKSTLVIIGYPANFSVVSPDNNIKTSKDGVIAFTNPKSGKYKLSITPETPETLLMIGQFLKNGKYKWKEYTLKNHLPKFGTIEFNSENLLEEPFE